MILAGRSFKQRVGELVVTGYLVDMASVFEDFVCVALREALAPFEGRSELQHRTFLDADETVPIRPDFVWFRGGRPCLVADAKYKAEKPSGFPQADMYQILAYCIRLGLPRGHLIYAQGQGEAQTFRIDQAGVTVTAHTLNLRQPPDALLADMGSLARTITPAASGVVPAQ